MCLLQPKFILCLAVGAVFVSVCRGQDWAQWGRSSLRNNVVDSGKKIPTIWNVGKFDRKTGDWIPDEAVNIKWVAKLGSQSYGQPIVADGRIFVGTNNNAGYLKRYPSEVDLGCLLCFRESDGEFLWQYSSEKLATGRVHDWPYQGIVSAPLVEGNRLWFVSNRGEIICADTEGFYDDEDDGPDQDVRRRLFSTVSRITPEGCNSYLSPSQNTLRAAVETTGLALPKQCRFQSTGAGTYLIVTGRRNNPQKIGRLEFSNDLLHVSRHVAVDGKDSFQETGTVPVDLLNGLDEGSLPATIRAFFKRYAKQLPEELAIRNTTPDKVWTLSTKMNGTPMQFELRVEGKIVVAYQLLPATDRHEADVVWSFDMMGKLGVRQHNLATCCITSWGDTLFVCTSNGVDETHVNIPAPEAPSFIAVDKRTGRLLWTDNSPGNNILHGQWSAPAVAELGGVPQVIFPGGDGWIYSFRADRWEDNRPELLWKFDANPKDTKWRLFGGTRNNIIAIPVIYDGRVYVPVGQDPEHGEGPGHLWCIDPTKRGDVSAELLLGDDGTQQVESNVVPNPNSAVVWHYESVDVNGDGKIQFEEQFHRSIGSVAIKNDLLFICDLSGLVHCLDAKTGRVHWTCDLLASCWVTPLIVNDRVYIGDQDGDVVIFQLSADPTKSFKKNSYRERNGTKYWYYEPNREIFMNSSIYATPTAANGVLYIANRSWLYAIASPEKEAGNRDARK
jgi:outer membrane protein assembly factor BamB